MNLIRGHFEEVKMNRIRPIESTQKPMIRKCMVCHREIDVAKGDGVRIRFNKGKYKTICGTCLDYAVKCAPHGIKVRIYNNLDKEVM